MYRQALNGSPPRSGILLSPRTNASQTTMVAPASTPIETPDATCPSATAASTVKLVTDDKGKSCGADQDYFSSNPAGGKYTGPPDAYDGSPDRISLVSELVSSYYAEVETLHERLQAEGSLQGFSGSGTIDEEGTRSRIQLCDNPKASRLAAGAEDEDMGLNAKKPQLSWFLTLVILTVVTVVCTFAFC